MPITNSEFHAELEEGEYAVVAFHPALGAYYMTVSDVRVALAPDIINSLDLAQEFLEMFEYVEREPDEFPEPEVLASDGAG